MKKFLKNVFSQTGMKVFIWVMLPVAVVFSIAWTFQDNAWNFWPLIYWTIFMLVIIILSWILRNNP